MPGADSRDSAWCGVRCRGNPRSGARSYDPEPSLGEFANCSWSPLLFRPINFAEGPHSRNSLFPSRELSLIANFKRLAHNWSIHGTIYPLTGAAVMRISMRWATAAGAAFSFSFSAPFSVPIFCSVHTLSISAVDPHCVFTLCSLPFEPFYL